MFDGTNARLARTQAQAEDCILRFVAHSLTHYDRQAHQHIHDYDLYLPWLLEVVTYEHVPPDSDPPELVEIDRLYMDAAWGLVVRGLLRPGPRTSSIDTADGLGKGYTLTQAGRKHIHDLSKEGANPIKTFAR